MNGGITSISSRPGARAQFGKSRRLSARERGDERHDEETMVATPRRKDYLRAKDGARPKARTAGEGGTTRATSVRSLTSPSASPEWTAESNRAERERAHAESPPPAARSPGERRTSARWTAMTSGPTARVVDSPPANKTSATSSSTPRRHAIEIRIHDGLSVLGDTIIEVSTRVPTARKDRWFPVRRRVKVGGRLS